MEEGRNKDNKLEKQMAEIIDTSLRTRRIKLARMESFRDRPKP